MCYSIDRADENPEISINLPLISSTEMTDGDIVLTALLGE